jgi:hypothetical protein
MPANSLFNLELAILMPGAHLVNSGVSQTWKAPIKTENGNNIIAFVKILPINQIISEIVGALLGKALGLKMPAPYLVKVNKNYLPDTSKWPSNDNELIAFGSADINFPSFSRFTKHDPIIRDLLYKWGYLKRTIIFDIWIANIDRHDGNLLFDGVDFWLIDHGYALTGPNWKPVDLKPSVSVENKLLSPMIPAMTTTDKHSLKLLAETEAHRYEKINIGDLKSLGKIENIGTAEQASAVLNFLHKRIDEVVTILCNKIGIPTLDLAE